MIEITQFQNEYTQDIIDLVLHFQNDGTRPNVTVNDQPDLLNITKCYINEGENFWIAKDNCKLIGSIGIMPCGNDIAILKKFFVYEKYQGTPYHVGRQLYSTLLSFAKENNFKTIVLDTPNNTTRAHKFYEKAGFQKVEENQLPIKFKHIHENCDFFLLNL